MEATDNERQYGLLLNAACNAFDDVAIARERLRETIEEREQAERAVVAAQQQLDAAITKNRLAQRKLKEHPDLH